VKSASPLKIYYGESKEVWVFITSVSSHMESTVFSLKHLSVTFRTRTLGCKQICYSNYATSTSSSSHPSELSIELLGESLALLNTSVLVSSKRRIRARYENVVKVIVKFIRKGIYYNR
jgi:hypothetical protein